MHGGLALPPRWQTIKRARVRELRRIKFRNWHYHRSEISERTGRWVEAVFARCVSYAMSARRKTVPKVVVVREGAKALIDAGFAKRRHGVMMRKAEDMLSLPKIQNALDSKFNAVGLTMDRSVEIIANVAEGSAGDDAAIVALKLRAVDMRIRLTTGYAPTKSASIQAHMNVDGFFNEEQFKHPPPITVDGDRAEVTP